MPTISEIIIPVKNESTGKVTNQTFSIGGGGGTSDIGLSIVNGQICVTYDNGQAN